MSVFRRKVLKVVPVWLMLIVTIGTVTAAFTWISNKIQTNVSVEALPIILSGTFATSAMTEMEQDQCFPYTVNTGSPSGYVFIRFSGADILSVDDVTVRMSVLSASYLVGVLQAGYPIWGAPGELRFLFGAGDGVPFNFGGVPNGLIYVYITYHVAGSIVADIQVTSTSS